LEILDREGPLTLVITSL